MATKYKDSGSSIRNEKLGMRNYKDSGIPWIGSVPEDWKLFQTSTLFHEHKEKNIGMKNSNLLSLSYGSIKKKDINTNEGLLPASFETYNVIEKGDIVFRLTDLQNDKRSLRTGLCKEDGIITSAYVTLRASQNLDSRFFHYLFHTYDICKVFYGMGDGVRQGMNYDDLRKLILVFPPLPTQQRIADFLDRKCAEIDELAALQETMIEELKRYKQSLITETVTKGLDSHAPMKDSGVEWIGEIPEGWVVLPFKQMYQLGKGLSITKADLVEQGVPVVSYGQIHSKSNTGTTIKDELIRYVPTSFLENSKDALVKIGDVIFADTSEDLEGCGNCIYVDRDMTLFAGYHTIIASNRSGSFSRYLPYLFKTDCWRMQIRAVVNGVKLFSVPQKTLAATSIILPPLSEQQQIADFLDSKCAEINELIAIKQQKIEALKEYKKSVIFEYVTGKKEVE